MSKIQVIKINYPVLNTLLNKANKGFNVDKAFRLAGYKPAVGFQKAEMEKATKQKEYQNHYCDNIPTEGIAVIYTAPYYTDDKKQWWLYIYEEATEEDVEEFEAEEVGEMITNYEIPISFCPFCGIDLRNIEITCI
jgi:hypothetical protein